LGIQRHSIVRTFVVNFLRSATDLNTTSDEHYKREPGCPFFTLINQYPAPKKGRAKAARTSKASRLSVQSVATVATTASDLVSAADITADHDDSVMTTASTMTQGKKRATARGSKATTGKARKTKAKKDEPVEILEDEPQVEEPSKQGAARGRKRASDAMEDSAMTNAEEPAPKKRTTRVRGSAADNSSIPDVENVDAIPAKQPAARKKARASTAKRPRKVSQVSVSSQASAAPLRANIPDDDEIDRQLEADLERYETDAEVEGSAVEKPPGPARGRPKKAASARKPSSQRGKGQSESYAVFDPTPMVPDEAEIDAEFEALRAEVQVPQPLAPETLVVPKKGRKAAGTRKASKQTKKAKAPVAQSESVQQTLEGTPEPAQEFKQANEEVEPKQEQAEEPVEDPDVSTGTVVTKPVSRPSTEKRGRGRPSKKSTSSQMDTEQPKQDLYPVLPAQSDAPPETTRTRSSLVSAPKSTPGKIPRKPVPVASYYPPNSSRSPALAQRPGPVVPTPTKLERVQPGPPSSASRLPAPATPRARGTPLRRASQAVISPSQSPQSSDAENRPPTLRPAASITSKRVALAPVSQQTPLRSSPSKRNVVAGLQSTTPWQPADLDVLFSPTKSYEGADKENSVARLLRKGSELTSPEKRMTIEEWIYHNASLAEQKLKHECETMVSAFEREGCRALSVLEGLIID
jgi:hypothetical protein